MIRDEVVAYLRGLSVEEVRSVLHDIEDVWSSSIIVHEPCLGCHQIVFGPHACPGPQTEAEPYEFKVVLVSIYSIHTSSRVPVMQALRAAIPAMTVREAMDLTDRLPIVVQSGLSRANADDMARRLREAGAVVEVRPDFG